MSSIFPIRSEAAPGGQDPRVVELEGEEADEVFDALSSETARRIVTALHEEPRTQSDLADAVDTTVQNVRYHLDKLEEAGLVEVVDTWYSSRGNEMDVYAPADGALIVSGDRGRAARLKNALSRLVGGGAVIGLASLAVQALSRQGKDPFSSGAGGAGGTDGGDGGAMEPTGEDADAPVDGNLSGDDAATTVAEGSESKTRTVDGMETTAETTTPDPVTVGPDATTTPEQSATPTTVTDGGVDAVTTATDTATTAADGAVATAAGLPPGLLFFLGGLSVLLVMVAVQYWASA